MDEITRQLREAITHEDDPERLERLSAALADLLRTRKALEDAGLRANQALGLVAGNVPAGTLHEALVQVLRERATPMNTRELTEEVNRRGLYRQRRGAPLPANQTSARVHNYPHIFQKLPDGRVSLVEWEGGATR